MASTDFTVVSSSTRRDNKRQNQARRKVLMSDFDTIEWPRLRAERAATCRTNFEKYQACLPTESKVEYEERIKVAVDAALRKYDLTYTAVFETYVAKMSTSTVAGGATLMPVPADLRVALPLPPEEASEKRPAKPATHAEPLMTQFNAFDALAEDSPEE